MLRMRRNHSEVYFPRAPLKQVIAQVRFPSIDTLFRDEPKLQAFSEKLQANYPRMVVERERFLSMSVRSGEMQPAEEVVRRYSADERMLRSVILSNNALTLDVRDYSLSKQMLAHFEEVLLAGQSALEISKLHRLGVRYINQIQGDDVSTPKEWTRHLERDFVGFAPEFFSDEPGEVEQMAHEVRFKGPDGMFAVRHGLLRGQGVANALSSQDSGKPYYLLDLDCWDEQTTAFEVGQVLPKLEKFTRFCLDFFLSVITDEYRQSIARPT